MKQATLLLPIHDLKRRRGLGAGSFCFARWFHFMSTLLGRIILSKNKEKKKKNEICRK
jgi:hypothetical protein